MLSFSKDKEWSIDYPWFSSKVAGGRVMDTGFIEHNFFTKELCDRGFSVYGVDLDEWDYRWVSDNFNYVKTELCEELPFSNEFFDCIVSPSLIEHLGLGHYGDIIIDEGDSLAVGEFYRVLKPSGVLLVQIPFGSVSRIILNGIGKPFYKTYTDRRIRRLFSKFTIKSKSYAIKNGWWEPANEDEAMKMDYCSGLTPCIVRLEAVK